MLNLICRIIHLFMTHKHNNNE
ncbi:hypothetical protein G9298_02665 [Bacillus thuringiensis]|nr:hypothetical protein G9298_02665 [Bacillus thuringiensis]